MASRASSMGLPQGIKVFSPFPFGGMNLIDSPVAIQDNEFLWLENWVKIGNGNLRTVWDVGTALYTSASTIVSHYFYTIGTNYYVVVFHADGSAVQVNTFTGVQTIIPGTFYVAGGELPACTQWGTLYLLISNRNTVNDYWAWDGSQVYTAGSAAPNGVLILSNGSNYTSLPTVTAYGGHGTGLTVVPTINAGGVVELTITNPGTGYEVGDVVQLAFSGGGSDNSAILEANLSDGGVSAVNITAPGSGYTSATVAFSGGGGTGATGTVLIGSGVTSVAVNTGGTGYTTATVTFVGGGGSGAAATANITAGVITSITVTSSGSGYTSAPAVAITGDGTGATATATVGATTGVVGILITNPGTGYTSAPTVTISGTGTGATGVAILSPGSLGSVTVVNGGSGFTSAPAITFVGGGGSGATGIVNLTGTSVAKVNVTAGGNGYTVLPTIMFTGGGDGAVLPTAVATLAQGQVVAITVTDAGSNITNQPEILIIPGTLSDGKTLDSGSGAGAVAVLAPTSIGSVTISNYGHGYTDAPAMEISPGSNNAAYATVSLMPFGVSGSAMETYQQRVWIVNPAAGPFETTPPGGNFQVSAPGTFIDFASSDGGVQFTNSDRFLQTRYVGVRQSNGYLYMFGDGSISIISSVNTSGDPATTTFNYQNVDPQTGLSFRDSMQDFSKTILFGNETGIFGLYGGTATMASAKLNQLFQDAIFPPISGALLPSSSVATIFDVRHYMMLMTVKDPDTGTYRNVMATWNQTDWTILSQTTALNYISSQKISSKLYAWGSDGSSLYPLFNRPSANLVKRMDSKYYGAAQQSFVVKTLMDFYLQGQDRAGNGVSFNVDIVASGVAMQPADPELATETNGLWSNVLHLPANFNAPSPFYPLFGTKTTDIAFTNMGFRATTSAADYVFTGAYVVYKDVHALIG